MAKKRNKLLWQVIIIGIFIVGFYYWRPLTLVTDRLAAQVAGQVLRYYYSLNDLSRSVDKWFATKSELEQSLRQLQQERASMLEELIALRAQQRYGDDIHELTVFRDHYQQFRDGHIVHILLKHFGKDSHYFLVDGGTNDGFVPHMIAVINNHLVGKVVELYPTYAKVQLITDKTLKVAVCCAQTKAYGIYTGACTKVAALNFVDHLQEVAAGDMVLSSGTGLFYPQGLCLGTIIRFVKKDADYEIVVKPLIDLEHLEYCFLLPPLLMIPEPTPSVVAVP